MSRVYDNWERLVEATLDREHLRYLAHCDSLSTATSSDFSSRFSFDHSDVNGIPSYHAIRPIKFEEIKKATQNFRQYTLYGVGGFDQLYKGWINEDTLTAAKPGAGMAVAVKINDEDGIQSRREWLAEINYLSRLCHPNLVKLIGYCSEGHNLLLVYEFVPRGSLENQLFTGWHQFLPWNTRLKVAIGAATGVSFLHNAEIQVIFRDFKASRILLDSEFNAKLSDLSLALDGGLPGHRTPVSCPVIGTYGYSVPEYIRTGLITVKCDVYSFGVLLTELLSGRRVIDHNRVKDEQNLVEWAKPYLRGKKKLSKIMDPKFKGQYPKKEAYIVATLAFKCLSQDPRERPTMGEVLLSLQQITGLQG